MRFNSGFKGLTFNNCTLCPHCICVFCFYLGTNSDFHHLLHKLTGFYNQDEKCLQRGTDWVFKYSSLRFVFKGLMTVLGTVIAVSVIQCVTNHHNLVNKANLMHILFLVYLFINLYMFRAAACPSSEETTAFMQHLVLVTLCG